VTSHRRTAAVAAVALSSLLAACGSSGGNGEDGRSADQIVQDAKAALASATSYHLAGFVDASGSSSDKVTLDVKVQNKDTMAGHLDEGGASFDFVSIGGKVYFRGPQLWQKTSPTVADMIGDKWVTATGNSQLEGELSSVNGLADASSLADSLGSTGGPYTKGGTSTVNGQQVVVVKSKDGELDVALNGKPYPLHLDAGSHGRMDISGYGSSFGITAPSGALDFSSLQSSSTSTDSSSASDTTKAVVDAVKVRDGVLKVAEGTITSSSGSVSDAWGVGQAITAQLPASIDVSVQSGDASSLPPATPTHIVLYAAQTSSGDLFLVVTLDTNGTCAIGALTGNPPTGNPTSQTLPAGTDCTVANALNALQS